jgi:excisionase family DNA binding protein
LKLDQSLVRLTKPILNTARGGRRVVKLRDYLRISDAADYLGVSPNTLRNWERAGKIVAHRHPVNRYRLFRREDLDALLRLAERPPRQRAKR